MITEAIKAKYVGGGMLKVLGNVKLPKGEELTLRVEIPDQSEALKESDVWLRSNLSGKLPPYKWGKNGLPETNPVRYDRRVGFVIVDDQR